MKFVLFSMAVALMTAYGGYLYGKSQARVTTVEKQVEVIKYVAQKRAKIQAQPNANRDKLLELMRSGNL